MGGGNRTGSVEEGYKPIASMVLFFGDDSYQVDYELSEEGLGKANVFYGKETKPAMFVISRVGIAPTAEELVAKLNQDLVDTIRANPDKRFDKLERSLAACN